MIASGYEDDNDASALRLDPAFNLAQGVLPSDLGLASQPTISRFENLPDVRSLPRVERALVDLYRTSFRQTPKRVAPDPGAAPHIGELENSVKARFEAGPKTAKLRRFKEFYDGAASWSRVRRRSSTPALRPSSRFFWARLSYWRRVSGLASGDCCDKI
jgi:hypothetical protein